MNWGKILTWAMAVLCLAASVGYFWQGDWKRGVYFVLCTGLNTVMAL
jgi:hypothetical protein